MFEHVKLSELDFEIKQVNSENGRKYVTPSGKAYPSVTTVLSSYNKQAILEWRQRVGDKEANRISSQASRRGTAMHSYCEKYLLNEMTAMKLRSMLPNVKQLFRQLTPHLDANIGKVYCLEKSLYSDILQIAGQVDCIAEWEGKLSVIDFKTASKYKKEENIQNYFMQCTAYALMFEHLTGIVIDQIVVAIAVEEGDIPQFFIKEKNKYVDNLLEYVRQTHEKS